MHSTTITTGDSAEWAHTRASRLRPVRTMDASGVANLTQEDDIRHDHDGDLHDDMFPLLDRLLEVLPEVMERFVLPALDPTALALLARVGRGWHSIAVSSGLPRAGITSMFIFIFSIDTNIIITTTDTILP